jgi:hypothetical protein
MMAKDKLKRRASLQPADRNGPSTEIRDLDHYDALTVIRNRCLGLRCAIDGAGVAEAEDLSGLQQLAADLIESINVVCSAFAEDRGLQARKR